MHISNEKAADNNKPSAIEFEGGRELPDYTDTEIMMDDMGLSLVEFMSRFEKFRVNEISIDDTEDDEPTTEKYHLDHQKTLSSITI